MPINFSYSKFNGNLVELFELDEENDKNHWTLKNFNSRDNIVVAMRDDLIIGFIIYSEFEIIDILRIVVAKDFRNMGVALALIDWIKNINKDIMLEVMEGNISAINLYKKCGFVEINIRKNYYSYGETAIVMKLS